MPNELHTLVNFDKYAARMAAVTDKEDLLQYVSGSVLDYGCGDGPMAHLFSPDDYVGYDIAPAMIKRARRLHPEYTFTSDSPTEHFGTVIMSSLLHEVYSYGNHTFEEVSEVLRQAASHADRIVVRDGIASCSTTEYVSYEVRNPVQAEDFLYDLQDMAAFEHPVTAAHGVLTGIHQDVANFLNVWTWGREAMPREGLERVNFANLEQWYRMVEDAGLRVVTEQLIIQPGYFKHLDELVDLNGDTWVTKLILVLEKTKTGESQ